MTARPLAILMVADVDPVHVIGGGERMLHEYAVGLAARGHRVTVLTRRENKALPPEETFRGCRVVRHEVRGAPGSCKMFGSILQEGRRTARQLLSAERFDVANLHQPLAGAAVLPVLQAHDLPRLYTFLSPWAEEYLTRRGSRGLLGTVWTGLNLSVRHHTEADVLRNCQAINALSRFSVSQLVEMHGLRAETVEVIPGGVDVERFRPVNDREGVRRSLGMGRGPVLLTVRNLEARMGLEALLEAMPSVLARHPQAQLLIGGKGSLRSTLESRVAALGLGEQVRLLGFVAEADLPRYYAACDVFVLPTRCLEGFGLVTVEALACGTPVLGTPVGSTPEILGRLDAKLLFKSPEPGDLADGMLAWLEQDSDREEWSRRCRELAVSSYAWPVVIEKMEDLLYRTAVTRRRLGGPDER